MDRACCLSRFGSRVGRTATPLRTPDRNGTFPARCAMTGQRYCTEGDALRVPGEAEAAPQGAVAVCGRVSRRGQGTGRHRQGVALETDCLHFRRRVFPALRARMEARESPRLLLAHRDRWPRFGCDGCKHFATQPGGPLAVVHRQSLSPQAAMVEDPMAIVHTFSGRLYGPRSHRQRLREADSDG